MSVGLNSVSLNRVQISQFNVNDNSGKVLLNRDTIQGDQTVCDSQFNNESPVDSGLIIPGTKVLQYFQ